MKKCVIENTFSAKGEITSASMRMLEDYVSPVTATVVNKLIDAGVKLERADLSKCLKMVADDKMPFAVVMDNGNTLRMDEESAGLYRFKPTYGAVSRYGVVAYTSSYDCVGVVAKTVGNISEAMSLIAGQDVNDSTSLPDLWDAPAKKTVKIGVISDFEASAETKKYVEKLKKAGCEIGEVSMPIVAYANAINMVIGSAEYASNTAKMDGVRYGLQNEHAQSLVEMYGSSRAKGFSYDDKLVAMFGALVVSYDYYEEFFVRAARARTLLIQAFEDAFKQYDVLLSPICCKNAVVAPSLAGLPAVATPENVQLIGTKCSDTELLRLVEEIK